MDSNLLHDTQIHVLSRHQQYYIIHRRRVLYFSHYITDLETNLLQSARLKKEKSSHHKFLWRIIRWRFDRGDNSLEASWHWDLDSVCLWILALGSFPRPQSHCYTDSESRKEICHRHQESPCMIQKCLKQSKVTSIPPPKKKSKYQQSNRNVTLYSTLGQFLTRYTQDWNRIKAFWSVIPLT